MERLEVLNVGYPHTNLSSGAATRSSQVRRSGLTRLADPRAKCSLCFWLVRKLPPKVDGRLHFVCALRCQVPYVAKVALS